MVALAGGKDSGGGRFVREKTDCALSVQRGARIGQFVVIGFNSDYRSEEKEMKIMAETKGGQATMQQKTKEPQQGNKRDQQPSKGIQTTNPQGTQQRDLTRREPFGLMNRFADEMDRLFGEFGFGRGLI